MPDFRKILVPTDFSEPSERALETAIALAKTVGGEIHLIHTYPAHPVLWPYVAPLPEALDLDLRAAAQPRLSEWSQRVADAGLRVVEHLVPGVAAEVIAGHAHDLHVDLVVMGTRGLGGLKHVLLGSVTERVIQLAPCPVMAVPIPETQAR